MEREPSGVRRRVSGAVARADQRARVALRLGPIDAVRAAVRARRSTRRQIGLVVETAGLQAPPIPGSRPLEPTDGLTFRGFSELVPETAPSSLLELLWYERFAATGAETLLVARDGEGRPTFSTWMLSPAGQQLHNDRFLEGFHPLEPDEMLLEGVFTFPHARGRGVARAGIAAACAWAGGQGATRVWAYPYLDNRRILPVLASCGLTAVDARVEVSSFGQARGRREPLSETDLRIWEEAVVRAAPSR
jgi:GNAT superfamily N-acetyltransferase